MDSMKQGVKQALLLVAVAGWLVGQEPASQGANAASASGKTISDAAIKGSKQDPAAFERGSQLFAADCAGCHGREGNGGPGAPDLIRSLLVLDDEKGILIAPVIREGRPEKGMPKLGLNETQIADLVAWLHVKTYSAGHRGTYTFGNIVTGNAEKGKLFFNGQGDCVQCHSPTKDLAGIGSKYDPFSLQGRWLNPRSAQRKGGGPSGAGTNPEIPPTMVTVTFSSGKSVSGLLEDLDDFTVSLRDSSNVFHSFKREGGSPKVEVHDPLQAHNDLLNVYTDADIHNITAYLVTLK